jgi:hypothetical protein
MLQFHQNHHKACICRPGRKGPYVSTKFKNTSTNKMIFVSTAAFHRFLRRRYPRILMWHRGAATRAQLSANPFRPWILSRGTWPRMLHLYCAYRCCESSQYGIRFVRVWHHPCLKRNPWQPNQCRMTLLQQDNQAQCRHRRPASSNTKAASLSANALELQSRFAPLQGKAVKSFCKPFANQPA